MATALGAEISSLLPGPAEFIEVIWMSERPFDDYRYCAFISFATLDDDTWNSWVSCFTDELEKALPGRLHGVSVPPPFLSSDNPLVSGSLSEMLRAAIDDSFAMFLIVHDNYLESEWCLKELEYFKSLFGDDGFRDRLYIIAMSKPAIVELSSRKQWKDLCPFSDQLWLEFFRHEAPEHPIEIYASNTRKKRVVVANPFWELFAKVRDDLALKILSLVARGRKVAAYPQVAVERTVTTLGDQLLVRVYIEANPDQEKYFESLGREVEVSWEQVIATLKVEPRLYLRPTGLPMTDLERRPFLDDADGVVLLWGKKTPDAVAAQIHKVEPKLNGPKPAPGLVAYLMNGPNDQPAASSIENWNVVRFQADEDGRARVLKDDVPALEAFLSSVLAHKRR